MHLFYLILTCVASVSISLVCSLAEAALLSLSAVRLEALKREGKRHAAVWLRLKKNIDKPISAILILNTISNTGGATLAGFLFDRVFGHEWLWAFLLGLTLSILFLAEIGPKILGAVYCEKLAPTLGPGLYTTTRLLQPLIRITEAFSKPFKGSGTEPGLSAIDIEVLAQLARNKNVIGFEQEQIIINAAKLRLSTVGEIMLPARWIVSLNLQNPVQDNLRITQHALHTRYPVSSSSDVNDIHGYINYKDLVAVRWNVNEDMEPHEISLEAFIRPILSVEEGMDLNTAFRRLTARRHHIALVRNKEDQVVGLITLEDLIEELVGEIEDEFDQTTDVVVQIRPDFWKVGANLTMEKLASILQVDLNLPAEEQSLPMANWLKEKIGDVRYPGISYQHNGLDFYVQQARRGKIFQVLVEVTSKAEILSGVEDNLG